MRSKAVDNPHSNKTVKNTSMNDYLKYWPLAIFVGGIISTWAIFGVRLSGLESLQDKQGEAVKELQQRVSVSEVNYAKLDAKIEGIKDDVTYIRNRIDSAVK